jgi:hypothetical protein
MSPFIYFLYTPLVKCSEPLYGEERIETSMFISIIGLCGLDCSHLDHPMKRYLPEINPGVIFFNAACSKFNVFLQSSTRARLTGEWV